jgi:hypothetical protein
MRVTYQDGKLLVSLTRDEVKQAQDNIGRPIELPIGQLKMLHEDVSKAVLQRWEKVEVPSQVSYLRK